MSDVNPLNNRPILSNVDGSFSTEESVTLTHPRLNSGKPTNVPSIWAGKRFKDEDAIVDQALKSGNSFKSFDTIEAAVSAARARSDYLAGGLSDRIEGDLPFDAPGSNNVAVSLEARSQLFDDRRNVEDAALESDDEMLMSVAPIDDEELPGSILSSVGKDLWKGATESTSQIYGGIVDAVGEIADLGQTVLPAGSVQLFNEEGDFDPAYFSAEEFNKARAEGKDVLSKATTDKAKSTTGSAIRSISQFLAPFGAANKALKAAGMVGGKAMAIGRAATAGAVTDFAAFDGSEERLSNLIETFPGIKNDVTAYLAAKEGDGEIEGRLKNAVEGLGIGAATEALYPALRGTLRFLRDGKKSAANVARTADPDALGRVAKDMNLLGDPDAPLLATRKVTTQEIDDRLAQAFKETETGVPDDVSAKGLKGAAKDGVKAEETYINFARIDTAEDIQSVMGQMSDAMKDSVDVSRRGVRTHEQTKLAASQENAWKIITERRQGQPLNAEQALAARQLWEASGKKTLEIAKLAADNPSPENLYQFRRMSTLHHMIQKEVLGARAEIARAQDQWRIPVGGNAERMRDIMQALHMRGGEEVSADLARRVAFLAEQGDAVALEDFLEKSLYTKTLETTQEYWINALLSGPKTHLVNILSNASIIALSPIERRVAAGISGIADVADPVEIGEAMAGVHGVLNSFGEALRNAGKAFRTGQTGFGVNKIETPRTRSLSSTNWNIRSDSWVGRGIDTVGAATNSPGRLLQTEDEFFKTAGYRQELNQQAYRQAASEVRAGKITADKLKSRMVEIVSDPPESIRMESSYMAAYQTFTNEPGPTVKAIQSVLHKRPELKFILPFTNTPSNIISFTFQRTPLAPATNAFRTAIAEGGPKADIALARMAVGTMGLMWSIDMGMKGLITGSGPTDNRTEMQNWRRQGFQPYSIKIGDKWVAYNRMDPIGLNFGMGADIAEYTNNAEMNPDQNFQVGEAFAATVFSLAENMTSKHYLRGISDLMGAINDPQRFGEAYLNRFASSFIPAGVAEVARFQDPVMRMPHDLITSAKRRLPFGFSEDLPPRYDLWGREIRYESGLGKVYDAVSPLYVSKFKPEPIDVAMQANDFFIGMPSKSMSVNGERVSMKNLPAAYSRYVKLQGGTKPGDFPEDTGEGILDRYGDRTLLETLNDIVEGADELSEQYETEEDPEEKRDVLQKVVRRYRAAARNAILMEFPEITESAERKKAARIDADE